MRALLRVAVVLASASLLMGSLEAQLPPQVDSLAQKYRADFAVPDAPALTLLEADEIDLVRPSTVRELAVTLSGFTGEGGVSLPRAAAVEFSPGLLFFGRRLTLARYQRAAALYRLRLSVATRRREEDGPQTALALGLRTSLIDDSDLRTNQRFLDAAQAIIRRAAEIDAAAEDRAAEAGGLDAPVVYTAAEEKELAGLVERYRRLPDEVVDSTWNRRAFDMAVGLRARADSTGDNLEVEQYAAWLSYASGMGDWGQVVFGAKLASDRDSVTGDFGMLGSAAGRLYGGSNRQKVYLDFQVSKRAEEETAFLVSGGAELRVVQSLWATLSVGSEWGGEDSDGRLRARFAFKSGFPME